MEQPKTTEVLAINHSDEPSAVVSSSSFSVRDVLSEVTIALSARPGRTLLTALGTVLGVASLVATLGLAKTAGSQIVSRFNELEATEVTVEPRQSFNERTPTENVLPWDAEDRLIRLNGVAAAGTLSPVDTEDSLVRTVPIIDPTGLTEFQIPLLSASPGLFDATRTKIYSGRFFDEGHNERGDAVAVIGPGVADRLNIRRVDNGPALFVGDEPITVIGIIAATEREPGLLNSIIIPDGFAQKRFDAFAPAEVYIDVDIGAAELIAAQAPTALAPNNPDFLTVQAPASPKQVKADVQSDVNSLFLVLGGVSLLVGAIGIANVTLVSVLERTGEIGLRRALGATRRHIALQFVSESVTLGAFAGVLGTSLGIVAVVAVSASRQWSPVIDEWLLFAAPCLGAVIGLLAGTYPAWKASSIEPITALRSKG